MDSWARDSRGREAQLNRRPPRLFLVTDADRVRRPDFIELAEAALAAGGRGCALQLRAHGLAGGFFWERAHRLAEIARDAGASYWINDRLDLALTVRADGVQLGSASTPLSEARRLLGRSCWIGRSTHTAERARNALDAGADIAVLGNIYATRSHPERTPLGLEAVREASNGERSIVAIGGITPERVAEVMGAGAWGVAVLSGVWDASDAAAAVRSYLSALAETVHDRGL